MRSPFPRFRLIGFRRLFLLFLVTPAPHVGAAETPEWTSPHHHRVLLSVDMKGRRRSNSPAEVQIDFQALLGKGSPVDGNSVEVTGYREGEKLRVPHRFEPFFGVTKTTLHFVVPDEHSTQFAVYFDALVPGSAPVPRYHGIVGDGDHFCERFERREIAASHFDQFADLDGDGDLDLFKGGVEPHVYCYENVGGNRMLDRGRLTSGGELLVLPRGKSNRSWVTVAFHDLDSDGDQDFVPSFGDGPDSGLIVFYRNTTREHNGQLTFSRVGPLQTASGVPLAGGAQAGGWFPSVCFVKGLHGENLDALVGSNNHCWLYRGNGTNADGTPRFADAVPIQAGGADIVLTNPLFETGTEPQFSDPEGVLIVQASSPQMISGADAIDWNGDGDIDILTGQGHGGSGLRFYERDWIGDELHATHPGVQVQRFESKP